MLNSLLSIGAQALMNAQLGISVTSENIANVDTEGYSRRTVSYESNPYMEVGGWQVGTGATATEIMRHYNAYVETLYLSANGERQYWSTQADTLYNVETLFNESDDYGLSTALDQLFTSLEDLTDDPNSEAQRDELISYASTLADSFQSLQDSLQAQIETLNASIADTVTEANSLITDIATLNTSLGADPDNAELLDQRDAKIRDLSELLDIKTITQDNGMVTVLTAEGQTLVDGTEVFTLAYESPQATANLTKDSSFGGQIYFDGTCSQEFTIQFTSGGAADGTTSAATFRISLDGGSTWLTDENGDVLEFQAGGYEDRVEIEGVSIWFGESDDSSTAPTTDLSAGDQFTIVPKSGVYWYRTTSSKVNITPLASTNDESDGRLSGGKLGGLLAVRDQSVSSYLEEMDALAEELIWQVNYQHSQGAGLTHYSSASSINKVQDASATLAKSGLTYADRLASGGLSLALYDADTGESLGITAVDFSSITPPGVATFDPSQHSLNDVAAAINATFSGQVTATVSDGMLELQAASGVEFEFAGDTTGLLAALGINTFFSGDDLGSIAVDSRILADSNRVNCGRVDGTGLVTEGDATNIAALAALADTNVTINTLHSTSSQTLSEHLHSVVAQVGLDTDTSARNYTLANTLAEDLDTTQQSVAGVNLDEELALLTRYQQSYEAAAKLIQTAEELFDIVMSLKS